MVAQIPKMSLCVGLKEETLREIKEKKETEQCGLNFAGWVTAMLWYEYESKRGAQKFMHTFMVLCDVM